MLGKVASEVEYHALKKLAAFHAGRPVDRLGDQTMPLIFWHHVLFIKMVMEKVSDQVFS